VVSRIVALHLLAIVVTSICMPLALFLMLKYAAQELHDRALREQAAEILRYLERGSDGTLRLSLPPALAELYSEAYGRSAFAVLGPDGRVLFSSLSGNRAIVPVRPQIKPYEYFAQHHNQAVTYGVSVSADIGGKPILIQVAEDLAHRDVLID